MIDALGGPVLTSLVGTLCIPIFSIGRESALLASIHPQSIIGVFGSWVIGEGNFSRWDATCREITEVRSKCARECSTFRAK